jgi:hypothetical protein
MSSCLLAGHRSSTHGLLMDRLAKPIRKHRNANRVARPLCVSASLHRARRLARCFAPVVAVVAVMREGCRLKHTKRGLVRSPVRYIKGQSGQPWVRGTAPPQRSGQSVKQSPNLTITGALFPTSKRDGDCEWWTQRRVALCADTDPATRERRQLDSMFECPYILALARPEWPPEAGKDERK